MKPLKVIILGSLSGILIFSTVSDARFTTDPAASILLIKELAGYSNYGELDGGVDILQSGDQGRWTFHVPSDLVKDGWDTNVIIKVALDNHYQVAEYKYSWEISVNENQVDASFLSIYGVSHGLPSDKRFQNWRSVRIPVKITSEEVVVRIKNDSRLDSRDWIAIDRLGLEFE